MPHTVNIDYLLSLKNEQKVTAQEIADLSKVPVATVRRILSRQTDAPTINNMADIVDSLGGSLDILMGIKNDKDESKSDKQCDPTVQLLLEQYQAEIRDFQSLMTNRNKWLKSMFLYCVALTTLVVIACIIVALKG